MVVIFVFSRSSGGDVVASCHHRAACTTSLLPARSNALFDCFVLAGSLVYVLYGAHHSTATNAFPCVLQTNSRQMISHSEDGTDVKVTLEPLPIDPWGDSDDQDDEKEQQSLAGQQRKRGKKKDPFNPIDNIVMKL